MTVGKIAKLTGIPFGVLAELPEGVFAALPGEWGKLELEAE